MASVTFKNIYKYYPNETRPSVNNFDLVVEDGEFLVMVGPSGCGKSTTLRMLAGLETISEGDIYIGDRLVNYVSPKNRDIAMVFQNYALYPNMSVYENMALGLKLRKTAKHEVELRVNRAARILEIAHMLDKRPGQLSGGQKQRVALGRAIVREPQVFLMDEPLSNLDAKLRTQTRAEIMKLHHQLKTTTVYVTHDQTEAMTMGTRIVVMKDGVIQQVSAPQQLYDAPLNRFVAGFIGSPPMNFLAGRIVRSEDRLFFTNKRMRLELPDRFRSILKHPDFNTQQVELGIRSEHARLREPHDPEISELERIVGRISLKETMGADTYLYVQLGDDQIVVRAEAHTLSAVGDEVDLRLALERCHFFAGETGINLSVREDLER